MPRGILKINEAFIKNMIIDIIRNYNNYALRLGRAFSLDVEKLLLKHTGESEIYKDSLEDTASKMPVADYIVTLYKFIKGDSVEVAKVEYSLENLKEVLYDRFMGDDFWSDYDTAMAARRTDHGLLISVVEARLKLVKGEDLGTKELSRLRGLTIQGLSYLIKKNEINAVKKYSKKWIISNEECIRFIKMREKNPDTATGYYNDII